MKWLLCPVLLLVIIGACDPHVGVKFQPTFLPIEFSINSNGEIAVTRNHHIVTKVGTFTFEAAAGMDVSGSASETLLVINHQVAGHYVQSWYRLGIQGEHGKVCMNGSAELFPDLDNNAIVITAHNSSTHIAVVSRAERCPDAQSSTAPPVPRAAFTAVSFGKTREGHAPYHLNITFTGLKGSDCLVTWQTHYTDTSPNTVADTSGSVRTGVLPYDDDNWWIDELMVKAPSEYRPWGTVFKTYCPDDVFLASGW